MAGFSHVIYPFKRATLHNWRYSVEMEGVEPSSNKHFNELQHLRVSITLFIF